jgi:hypothetical protein
VDSASIVYDLGSGDGEIVVATARDYNAKKVVGIEQNRRLCSIALRKAQFLENAVIMNANYDDVDVSEANVVTLRSETRGCSDTSTGGHTECVCESAPQRPRQTHASKEPTFTGVSSTRKALTLLTSKIRWG